MIIELLSDILIGIFTLISMYFADVPHFLWG